MADIIKSVSTDGGTTSISITPTAVAATANGYEAACPALTANTTVEIQANKLASAGTTTYTKTAIYLSRTSNTKYASAKAVYEYIQSLY